MNRIERLLPIILSLLLPGFSIISTGGDLDLLKTFPKYLVAVLFLYSIWRLNDYLFQEPVWFVSRIREARLVKLTIVLCNLLYIALFIVADFYILGKDLSLSSSLPIWVVAIRLVMASLIFAVFQQVLRTTKQQESLHRQNLLLQTEKLKFELETVKQQINPHFLFNSINTLIDLIEEDQKRAVAFVRVFASMYRVVLQSSRCDFVYLEEELAFLNNYWDLLKMRFSEAVQLTVNIPYEMHKVLIPPLSLQMLIENAVKHNKATCEKPLRIEVLGINDTLIVQNNFNPKPFVLNREGLGLLNLQKRFSLLVSPIHYGVDNDKYKVILPLKKK